MTATFQPQALVRFLLTAYCPTCGTVVESQVLSCNPRFFTDGINLQPLSPEVLLRDQGEGLLWMHGTCGQVLVPVWSAPLM